MQDSQEVSKGDGIGDVGVVGHIGGELEVGDRAGLVSPLSSLRSSTTQRLFAAFLVLLAGGLSGGDGTVGACGCGGFEAQTCGAKMGAEMGGAVTNGAAIE
jgi:hypothetical protein